MVYKVVLTDQAQQDFLEIIKYPHTKFSLGERVAYAEALQACCFSLEFWPKRFKRVKIGRKFYHSITFKAHQIIYSVDDAAALVSIVTIRGGSMPKLTSL